MSPDLTVVIPAFQSARTLPRVLQSLRAQRHDSPHTVVVVDDGSTDGTSAVAAAAQREDGADYLVVISQDHGGAAAARNRGAAATAARLLLFLGADIVPQPRCLRRHRAVHARYPEPAVGCLGFVTWDSSLPPTPFMVFLEHGGPQNDFGSIAGETWVPPERFCYGANLSLKRATFLAVGGFALRHFPGYGWEDLELGVRLGKQGTRLFYEPNARGDHVHRVTVATAEARMRSVGRGARVLQALHPSLGVLDLRRERTRRVLRRMVFPPPVRRALSWVTERCAHHLLFPMLYRRVLSLAFYDGVHGGVDGNT